MELDERKPKESVAPVVEEAQEKVKVRSTEEGKLFIDPEDLFSLERIREIITKVSQVEVLKGSKTSL